MRVTVAMGASQSGNSAKVQRFPSEPLTREPSTKSAAGKNSFTRNQINRLLSRKQRKPDDFASNEPEVALNGYGKQRRQERQQYLHQARCAPDEIDDDGGFHQQRAQPQTLNNTQHQHQQQQQWQQQPNKATKQPQVQHQQSNGTTTTRSSLGRAGDHAQSGQQLHQTQRAGAQLARIVNTPGRPSALPSGDTQREQQLGKPNSELRGPRERANNYAGEAVDVGQAQHREVAMQQLQAQHRATNNNAQNYDGGGGSLSWSKQTARAALNGNQISASRGSNDIYDNNHGLDSSEAQRLSDETVDEIEQFYLRNSHLLTVAADQKPAAYRHLDQFEQHVRLHADDPYNSLLLLASDQQQQQQHQQQQRAHATGFLSAPQQRRYKRPKQQYQYFDGELPDYEAAATLGPLLALSPFATRAQDCYHLPISQAANESLIYYNNLNHHQLDQQQHYVSGGGYLAQAPNNNYAPIRGNHAPFEAATLGKRAATLSPSTNKLGGGASGKKSRNPLAAIFPFSNSTATAATPTQPHKQFHSNTFHLSSSKSHSNLLHAPNNRQQQQRQRTLGGGSLKRIKSAPLTAQQTSYEAMRTIDMYLIRQIARSCMDFEMEQKIDLEIRLRELASQSMLDARTEIDVLEVEKSLLTSDQRMNCYASQLEAQRKQLSNPSLSTDSGRASKTSHRRRDGSLGRSGRHATATTSGVSEVDNSFVATTSTGTGSPSFSSLSKSSQSSPSKLSPVSGESANSPGSTAGSQRDGAKDDCRSGALSSSSAGSSCHRSRKSNQAVIRQPTSSSGDAANTLPNRRNGSSSGKSKTRERLKRTIASLSNIDCNMVSDNRATLTISELRIPLMWRDVDHFKGRGEYRRYAVFCLLRIGSQIYDTQLISDVDRQMTDLTFDDVIFFNNVEHEFELTLEVYSCVYLEQFSLSSTPRKLKEKLSNSVSRAMGRRLTTQMASANFTKELEAYDKSYRFAMIASAKLGLPDVANSIKTYDLHLVSPEAHGRRSTSIQPSEGNSHTTVLNGTSHQQQHHNRHHNLSGLSHSGIVSTGNQKEVHRNTLPLFGHFCCNLHIRPDVFDKCVKSGYLRIATINLSELLPKQHASDESRQSKCGRSVSPALDSGKSSSSNDDLITTVSDNSMLRSALAASSKLASISLSKSTVHWALLRNFTLHLWHIDEQKLQMAARKGLAPQVDISGKPPFCISIDKFTRLLRVSNSSLTMETDKGCLVIAVYKPNEQLGDGNEEIGHWLRPIEQMIYDSHIWSSVLNHHATSHKYMHQIQ